jgi:hypothetical protein
MQLGLVFLLFFWFGELPTAICQLLFATWLGRMPVKTTPSRYAG